MEPQTATLAKCVFKVVAQSVHHFCCRTGAEVHCINYYKTPQHLNSSKQQSDDSLKTTGNWQITSSQIYLICPRGSTQTHLSQVSSCILSVPCRVWAGWKHCCLYPRTRVRAKKSSIVAHLLSVRTCRGAHISLFSPENDPVGAASKQMDISVEINCWNCFPICFNAATKPNGTESSCLSGIIHKLLAGRGRNKS